jgi:hypothetical protein
MTKLIGRIDHGVTSRKPEHGAFIRIDDGVHVCRADKAIKSDGWQLLARS